jgi:hypothetical protein
MMMGVDRSLGRRKFGAGLVKQGTGVSGRWSKKLVQTPYFF